MSVVNHSGKKQSKVVQKPGHRYTIYMFAFSVDADNWPNMGGGRRAGAGVGEGAGDGYPALIKLICEYPGTMMVHYLPMFDSAATGCVSKKLYC